MAKKLKLNLSTTIRMTAASFEITTRNVDTGETTTLPLEGHLGEDGRWQPVSRDQRAQIARVLCELHGIRYHRRKQQAVKQAVGVLVDSFLEAELQADNPRYQQHVDWERPEMEAFLGQPRIECPACERSDGIYQDDHGAHCRHCGPSAPRPAPRLALSDYRGGVL